ncbi:TonB-dependent receptor [Psychromonas sp. RZ22]|uniref:TonB-dependent receptor plug domain-containing protein n=1 Tax=Psychromonas algarum TaxID=2555643 RepID=UPI001068AF1E|nr:TonB-dependent receptor [Psychromonas sp. RZ22]TEW53962.1 TonB-dependent receptor [Psychromonas sp. RZ22]
MYHHYRRFFTNKVAFVKVASLSLFLQHSVIASEVYSTDTVVVTGTKTERNLLDVPVRTEVVTREQLQESHARDLAEGLKNVPGVMIKPIHGKTGQEIWLQGFDANRVLVLIDGLPVSASTGSSVDLTQISVADVDHVEIVKGSVSALYGSEAMGGVVNIITVKSKPGSSYQITVDGGGYGQDNVTDDVFNDKHVNLFLQHDTGTWFTALSADLRDKGGSRLQPDAWDYEGASGDKMNVSLDLGYHFDNGATLLFKPSYYRESVVQNFSTFTPGFGDIYKIKNEDATRKNITMSFDTPIWGDGKLSTWYIHEQFIDETSQDVVSTATKDQERYGESNFDKAEMQLDKNITDNHLLTLGVVAMRSDLQQKQIIKNVTVDEIGGKKERQNIEFYAQDDIFVGDTLEVLPGLRYQYDSDFGGYLAPKINLMYGPDWIANADLKWRLGLGHGYRVPTLKERHYVFDHSALGYMVIGNPDLLPETSNSVQFGGELNTEKFRADINFYYNDIDNLITTTLDQNASNSTGLSIFSYDNIGEAITQGVDISTGYLFSDNFDTQLSYTYLQSEDKETGLVLTNRPEHLAKLQFSYKVPVIASTFSVYGNYQSKEYIDVDNLITSPEYSTFDFKINTSLDHGITLFMGVDNLTDTVRDTPSTGQDLRPDVGRFVYVGFRVNG